MGSVQPQAPAFRDEERLRVNVPTAAPGNSGLEPRGARGTDAHTRQLRPQGPRALPSAPKGGGRPGLRPPAPGAREGGTQSARGGEGAGRRG